MKRKDNATPTVTNAANVAGDAVDGDSVKKPKYLKERNGTYYFVRRIPAKVVKALGLTRDQMWRSLHTTNRVEAIRKLPEGQHDFNELVASVKPVSGVK